jgi:hypothetical protein
MLVCRRDDVRTTVEECTRPPPDQPRRGWRHHRRSSTVHACDRVLIASSSCTHLCVHLYARRLSSPSADPPPSCSPVCSLICRRDESVDDRRAESHCRQGGTITPRRTRSSRTRTRSSDCIQHTATQGRHTRLTHDHQVRSERATQPCSAHVATAYTSPTRVESADGELRWSSTSVSSIAHACLHATSPTTRD